MKMLEIDSFDSGNAVVTAAALLAAVLVCYYLLTYRKQKANQKKKLPYPPGPPGHWLFGNMFDNPDFEGGETYDTKNLEGAKEYGLIFSVRIPILVGRMIIIGDPALARKVLATSNYPKSFFYKFLNPLIGTRSLVSLPNGSEWAGLRKSFNSGFTPTYLRTVVDMMSERLVYYLEAIDRDIRSDVPTNMLKQSQSLTSDIIVKIAFGEEWDVNAGEPHKVRVLEDRICRLYMDLIKHPLGRIFFWRTKRQMNQVSRELEEEMKAILARRLAAGDAGKSNDICSLAITHMTKESGGTLTQADKESIVDQLKTFYFAGHDTTAIAIAWAIWELSQHPEALARLRAELVEHCVWADDKTPPSYEQLQKCRYLECVVKESLRLYPPASGLSRYCDDPDESYKGYCIGRSILLVNAYVIHRHPSLWKEPDSFKPERFIDGSEGDINSKYMPFSKGPRDCIGKYFAYLEAKLAISALVMRYDMECDDPKDIVYTLLTNIPKHGAKVKFRLRSE